MRSTDDFNEAPVGTPAMQCCCLCGLDIPVVLLKMRGPSPEGVNYGGPRKVAIKGEYCEFCRFIGMYKAHEKYEGRMAVGKIVEG